MLTPQPFGVGSQTTSFYRPRVREVAGRARGRWHRAGRVALTSLEQGVVEGWHGQAPSAGWLTEIGSEPGRALLQGLWHLLVPLAHLAGHRGLCPAETQRNAQLPWEKGQNQPGQASEQPGLAESVLWVGQHPSNQNNSVISVVKPSIRTFCISKIKTSKHLTWSQTFFLLREKCRDSSQQ